MSLVYRTARSGDLPVLAGLATHSFPIVDRSRVEWEASLGRYGAEAGLVGELDGRIAAFCLLLPLRQYVAGKPLACMGLSAVAIDPTYRRRGIAGELVREALRRARDRGHLCSALYPFKTAFYQRLGYGMAGRVEQYELPPEAFPDSPERKRVQLVDDPTHEQALREVYDSWAPGQNGQLARGELEWARVWEGGREAVLYRSAGGEAQGYAIFRYPAPGSQRPRSLDVDEIIWLGLEARNGLLGWLGSLGDQWPGILYRAHPEDGFAETLSELRHPLGGVPVWNFWFAPSATLMGPMFRLLDVPGAVAQRSVAPAARLTLSLAVDDPDLPENRGPWKLEIEDGTIAVSRVRDPLEHHLEIGIEDLSRVYVGAVPLSHLANAGRIRGFDDHTRKQLDDALRTRAPWTFDRF